MKTDVDTALKDIADFYVKNRRSMTEPELEAILKKHVESEAEAEKFVKFLETEPGQLRFKTLLRERKEAGAVKVVSCPFCGRPASLTQRWDGAWVGTCPFCKRYIILDKALEKPRYLKESGSSNPEEQPSSEEQEFAEEMWYSTRKLVEEKDPYGTHIWRILEHYYPGDREKQISVLGHMNEIYGKYGKGPIPTVELLKSARKWGVEKMTVKEMMLHFPPD